MKETLDSIALRLGVSKSTVSRVLNGKDGASRISAATAERIRAEAENCFYSLPAQRRLAAGATVALLVPSISDIYFAKLCGAISSRLLERGMLLSVVEIGDDEKVLKSSTLALLSHKVDALIVVPCGQDNRFLEKVDAAKTPVVLMDHFYADSSLSYVTTDNYNGSLMATRELIGNGHRDILCLQGTNDILPNVERCQGYRDAMAEAGLEGNIRFAGSSFRFEDSYNAMVEVLNSGRRPSAVFALSNDIVSGAIKAIRQFRLDIPDDISIISFDNEVHTHPTIASIHQPSGDMAEIAVKIAIDRIAGAKSGTSRIRLMPKLINGESIKKLI